MPVSTKKKPIKSLEERTKTIPEESFIKLKSREVQNLEEKKSLNFQKQRSSSNQSYIEGMTPFYHLHDKEDYCIAVTGELLHLLRH